MHEVEAHIEQWIKNVSTVRSELNGFSVCPFASKAKTLTIETSAEDIIPMEGYDVIFFVVEDYFDLESLQFWVKFYNEIYPEYIFLEDHATYNTYINGIQTNNGKYNLILAQNREKLRKHRNILRDLGYYAHWNDEMMREILEEDYEKLGFSG